MIAVFGTEAGLFVDLFLLVLLLILPTLVIAIALVRRGHVRAHATINTVCFVLFLAAVLAFEAQVHLGAPGPPLARVPLVIHLCFAIPCLVMWIFQMRSGTRATTEPQKHRRSGKRLLAVLALTVATGIWLYVETFA